MSSTILRVCGSSSLSHVPDFAVLLNLKMDGATGSELWPRSCR